MIKILHLEGGDTPHRAWKYGMAEVPRDVGEGVEDKGTAWAQAASRSSRTLGSGEPSGCVASEKINTSSSSLTVITSLLQDKGISNVSHLCLMLVNSFQASAKVLTRVVKLLEILNLETFHRNFGEF